MQAARVAALAALATLLLAGAPTGDAALELREHPAALGTGLKVRIAPPNATVPPGGAPLALLGEVTYTMGTAVPASDATRITLHLARRPAWAGVRVVPDEFVFDPGASPHRATFHASFTILVTASRDAPAHRPSALTIEAVASENPPFAGATARDGIIVEAGFLAPLRAEAYPDRLRLAPGETGEVTLRLSNVGNAFEEIRVRTLEAPPGIDVSPAGLALAFHAPVNASGDGRGSVPLALTAGPEFAEGGRLLIEVRSVYPLQPELRGATLEVPVQIERSTQGLTPLFTARNGDWTLADAHLLTTLGLLGATIGAVLQIVRREWRKL